MSSTTLPLPTKSFSTVTNTSSSTKPPPSSILLPPSHFHISTYPIPSSPPKPPPSSSVLTYLKKKNPWLDPFDFGDDPEMEYGELFADGKQEEDTRPPDNPDNKYGFLKFPFGYNVEIASLGLKVRGDVRRCCCVISGGVYENLLFFPAIQLIKDRYPGVLVDIIASARGKQTYEINKNVRFANVYNVEDPFPVPAEYTDMVGLLKGRYYDMILSTKLAGLGHAAFLFMTTARDRVSYIYPNVNAAGAGLLLSETFTPEGMNLSDGGYNIKRFAKFVVNEAFQLSLDSHEETRILGTIKWSNGLGRPARNVPRQEVPPLKVSISKKLKEVVEKKYKESGAEKGKFIVIHGIESDSQANMQSRGDPDSLLPIQVWAEIAKAIKGVKPVFVIPHEKERENVEEVVRDDSSIVFITTPGQLTALINDSIGVISTNTAAIQLANAREKPSIALFCSEEKARSFIPNAEDKRCKVIASKTGKLIDIDVEAVKNAAQFFEVSLILA